MKSRTSRAAAGVVACMALWLAPGAWGADLRSDERVVFIPSMGSKVDGEEAWDLDFHAWALEPESRLLSTLLFRKALGFDGDDMDAEERATFNSRARWFLVDNERNKGIMVWLDGRPYSLGKTEANGRSVTRIRLEQEHIDHMREKAGSLILPFTTAGSAGGRAFQGELHLLESSGVSVISDIDDTIKISEVRDQRALLRNTFLKPFAPVAGMADVYRSWVTNDGAQFHYVSAGPWQLFVPLSEFMEANQFPPGTFHMKDFRWKDDSFFNLFMSPEEHKQGVIEPILQRFPNRRFIFVGDSGEKDPEVYGALARKHPKQLLAILIRNVTGEPEGDDRYKDAFAGVARNRWAVFEDSGKLPRRLVIK